MAHLIKSHVLKNLKVVTATVTDGETLGNSEELLVGSSIDYTPSVGFSNVVYEYTTSMTWQDKSNRLILRSKINGNWYSGYWHCVGTTPNGYDIKYSTLINARFVIPASVWGSGEKTLGIYAYSMDNAYQSILHMTKQAGGSTTIPFNPFSIVYSI